METIIAHEDQPNQLKPSATIQETPQEINANFLLQREISSCPSIKESEEIIHPWLTIEPVKVEVMRSLSLTGDVKIPQLSEDEEGQLIARLRLIPGIGILMAFISGICFATAGFTVEMIRVDSLLVVVFRSIAQLLCYGPACLYLKQSVTGIRGERWSVIQRSIFGFIAFTLSYYALDYVSLSDSSAIAFSAPVYVSIFACFILNEKCGLFQILTVIFTLIGVVLISRPDFIFGTDISDSHLISFNESYSNGSLFLNVSSSEVVPDPIRTRENFSSRDRVIGVILSFITSLTMAYTFIVMRKLQKTPVAVVITIFSIFCIVFGIICLLILNYGIGMKILLPVTASDYGWLIGNSICGVLGQLFLVLSLKLEEAGLVSLARTFDIVMAFIYQVIFLSQKVYWTSILGAIIVCSGVVACALKKIYESKPQYFEPLLRKFFCHKTSLDDAIKRNRKKSSLPSLKIKTGNGTKISILGALTPTLIEEMSQENHIICHNQEGNQSVLTIKYNQMTSIDLTSSPSVHPASDTMTHTKMHDIKS